MASKKNKQKEKTQQLFSANKKENYQSSLLNELKNSIAAKQEAIPTERPNLLNELKNAITTKQEAIPTEKPRNEVNPTPTIIFKKKQYKCPYCGSSIEPKVIDKTFPISVRCLECLKTGKNDDFLIRNRDEPSWNSVHFL